MTRTGGKDKREPGQRALSPLSYHRVAVVFGLVVLLLAGCPSAPPQPEPAAPPPVPTAVAPAPPPNFDQLLERARIAFNAHRLTTPLENSAYALYQEALRLDPNNDDARRGLEKIVERYVEFVLDAVDRSQFARARTLLDRARFVDADHPAITPTEEQLQLVENATHEREKVDRSLLKQRSARLALKLQNLGIRAVDANCRVHINAGSDADGRWIYRQINKGSPNSRIRARLQIASPPTVELVCLGDSEK